MRGRHCLGAQLTSESSTGLSSPCPSTRLCLRNARTAPYRRMHSDSAILSPLVPVPIPNPSPPGPLAVPPADPSPHPQGAAAAPQELPPAKGTRTRVPAMVTVQGGQRPRPEGTATAGESIPHPAERQLGQHSSLLHDVLPATAFNWYAKVTAGGKTRSPAHPRSRLWRNPRCNVPSLPRAPERPAGLCSAEQELVMFPSQLYADLTKSTFGFPSTKIWVCPSA